MPVLEINVTLSSQDIDECEQSDRCPNGTCDNFIGGFSCTCKEGYQKQGDLCLGNVMGIIYNHMQDYCFAGPNE